MVVGMLIWRTDGGRIGGGAPLTARTGPCPRRLRISLARQSCTALAPSVIEPPPTVMMMSALAARACSVAADHSGTGLCAAASRQSGDAARPQRAADFCDFVGVAVERAADHQERFCDASRSILLDDSLGCGPRTRPRPWRRIRHALYACACPPRTFWLCLIAVQRRLAEEIQAVMPEDHALDHALEYQPRRKPGGSTPLRLAVSCGAWR